MGLARTILGRERWTDLGGIQGCSTRPVQEIQAKEIYVEALEDPPRAEIQAIGN